MSFNPVVTSESIILKAVVVTNSLKNPHKKTCCQELFASWWFVPVPKTQGLWDRMVVKPRGHGREENNMEMVTKQETNGLYSVHKPFKTI